MIVDCLISKPGTYDILLGRGKGYFEWEGNVRYGNIISKYHQEYVKTPKGPKKSQLFDHVMEEILTAAPSVSVSPPSTTATTETDSNSHGGDVDVTADAVVEVRFLKELTDEELADHYGITQTTSKLFRIASKSEITDKVKHRLRECRNKRKKNTKNSNNKTKKPEEIGDEGLSLSKVAIRKHLKKTTTKKKKINKNNKSRPDDDSINKKARKERTKKSMKKKSPPVLIEKVLQEAAEILLKDTPTPLPSFVVSSTSSPSYTYAPFESRSGGGGGGNDGRSTFTTTTMVVEKYQVPIDTTELLSLNNYDTEAMLNEPIHEFSLDNMTDETILKIENTVLFDADFYYQMLTSQNNSTTTTDEYDSSSYYESTVSSSTTSDDSDYDYVESCDDESCTTTSTTTASTSRSETPSLMGDDADEVAKNEKVYEMQ